MKLKNLDNQFKIIMKSFIKKLKKSKFNDMIVVFRKEEKLSEDALLNFASTLEMLIEDGKIGKADSKYIKKLNPILLPVLLKSTLESIYDKIIIDFLVESGLAKETAEAILNKDIKEEVESSPLFETLEDEYNRE